MSVLSQSCDSPPALVAACVVDCVGVVMMVVVVVHGGGSLPLALSPDKFKQGAMTQSSLHTHTH